MDQSNIIKYTIERFAEILGRITFENNSVPVDFTGTLRIDSTDESPVIRLILLGVEENNQYNKNERITEKGTDNDGKEIEYLVSPSTLMDLSLMVCPMCGDRMKALSLIGGIIKHLKDNPLIDFGEYAWRTCDGGLSRIDQISRMPVEKQLASKSMAGIPCDVPALFYTITIGIDSDNKEVIRRVERRKFDFGDKERMEKKNA